MSIGPKKLNAMFKPFNVLDKDYIKKAKEVAATYKANGAQNMDDIKYIRLKAHNDNEHLKGDFVITMFLGAIEVEKERDRFKDAYARAKRYFTELENRITDMKEYIALLEEETDKWKGKGKTAKAFKEHGEAVLNLAKEKRPLTGEKGIAETVGLSPTTVIAILDEWRKRGEYKIPKRVGTGRKSKTAHNEEVDFDLNDAGFDHIPEMNEESVKVTPLRTLAEYQKYVKMMERNKKFSLSPESLKNFELLSKKKMDKELQENEHKE